ncbi:DUF3948 family protein, partial [Bacillus paranthracis]
MKEQVLQVTKGDFVGIKT